jgi:hypothetical protein
MLQTNDMGNNKSPKVNVAKSPNTKVEIGTIGINTNPKRPVTMRMILFVNINVRIDYLGRIEQVDAQRLSVYEVVAIEKRLVQLTTKAK